MGRVAKEVLISADAARVWRALTHERATWAATMIEEPLAAPLSEGSKIKAKRRHSTTGGRYVLTVTAFDAERLLAMHVERNGQPTAETRFELSSAPEGTRVRSVAEYELKGLQKLMAGVVQTTMEKNLGDELEALKRHVEARS